MDSYYIYAQNLIKLMLTKDEMINRLRPKCEPICTKFVPDVYQNFLYSCGCSDDSTCPECNHKNTKKFYDGCCYPRREDYETPVLDVCNCTTYYCRICARYVGTSIPDNIPSCIGHPTEDQYENHTGWSNEKLFKDLDIDFELAKRQTVHN
jgi:hypothetical protein